MCVHGEPTSHYSEILHICIESSRTGSIVFVCVWKIDYVLSSLPSSLSIFFFPVDKLFLFTVEKSEEEDVGRKRESFNRRRCVNNVLHCVFANKLSSVHFVRFKWMHIARQMWCFWIVMCSFYLYCSEFSFSLLLRRFDGLWLFCFRFFLLFSFYLCFFLLCHLTGNTLSFRWEWCCVRRVSACGICFFRFGCCVFFRMSLNRRKRMSNWIRSK